VELFIHCPIFLMGTTLPLKMTVFWDVAPCNLVEVYRRFRGACCLHQQGVGFIIVLIMEAASTSETSVNFYNAARRNISEDIFILVALRT
jgi:hypothetical protein